MDDIVRGLSARPHRLTSLGFSRADILAMDIDEALGHIDWLTDTRNREIKEAKDAADRARAAIRGGRT